ncbi:hypothetical protein BP6252_04738 [Coleophoma cylindrospora]|uniref:HhH-GPD domain-containing protein n=1 Tax=Coleophoma cylindrospora TaxID=1849047 RepID=A0A3D8S1S6_9HELO|nr:hypothetical protein BP6252_04738 [Coleophoma cylindrospora]
MVTRAAAKREAAFLAEASLSSPPSTPADKREYSRGKGGPGSSSAVLESAKKPTGRAQLPSPEDGGELAPSTEAKKRKRVSTVSEPITGDWDVLPHGIGKKGDLEVEPEDGSKIPPPKPRKPNTAGSMVKQEEPEVEKVYQPEIIAVGEDDSKKPPAKKRTSRKHVVINTSAPVAEEVGALGNASGKVPKPPRKPKANKYGLTPGESPFPDLLKPTPEDCEEVTRLLSELHGEVRAPDVIPPPSMEVAGCGEVPDLLDAILRTLLSASTTANNSNKALKGLKDTFGLRTSGVGIGSVNWEAVHTADLKEVVDSIRSGGLAEVKGANIKKILAAVWDHNKERHDALANEKETGQTAEVTGAQHEPQAAKNKEIEAVNNNMLSMDYVFELTTEEAMTEMLKLPGIGVKTASCVILFCMKRPSFAVDTHVWRHCKWLGWVPPTATRDQTFSHCEVRIPDHLKYPLHQLFLRHGKTCGRCRAATGTGSIEWKNANCPIDHLMKRTEAKKLVGTKKPTPKPTSKPKTKKAAAKKHSKNMKDDDDDTDSEEAEFSEHDSDE